MKLQDKVIVVTGSTNGIGFAIAKDSIDNGAKVVIHGRTQDNVDKAIAQLGADNTVGIVAELQQVDAAQKIIDTATQAFGRLDGLVNNAGIYPRDTIDNFTVEDFDKIFHVNLRAPMLLTQAAIKEFRKNQGEYKGTVINIGSVNSLGGLPKICTYSASKGALLTFTRNIAKYLSADRIRVNQLNVGWTLTDQEHLTNLAEGRSEDWHDNLPDTFCPWNRIWRPEEVATHTSHLLSDASGPMTGSSYELEQYPLYGHNFNE